MKTRALVICSVAVLWGIAGFSSAQAAKPAAGVEGRLPTYLNQFLSFDPASKVTVEKAADRRLPGFQDYKIKRTGKYAKLAVEKSVAVSDDGKWFFDGEVMVNANPAPGQVPDLAWLETKMSTLYRSGVKVSLNPERDAAGLKGLTMAVESGFGVVKMPGYVTPDGSKFLGGTLWDFQIDPREERRKRIDLSVPRFQGKPDGAVTIVEYADMECGYCRYRGGQMDSLLEANAKTLSYKRYYKFYPLWFTHAWAMKAASAADCLFRFAGQAMFAFKKQVYAEQATMTVSSIDELALASAEAAGVSRADFLGCYLREPSLSDVRRDIEEGQRLSVKSTPTYFVDGTEIVWVDDLVMEDFLRTKAPGLKTIDYGPHS